MIADTATIHETAIIDPTATVEAGVEIGAYAVIGPNVVIENDVKIGAGAKIGAFTPAGEQSRITIGKNTVIYPDAHIMGITSIGQDNQILTGAKIGGPPQDKGYNHEPTEVVIGNHNFIGENVTIHRGTAKDKSKTIIGDHNYIMEGSHIAHDCQLGNHITMADSKLAGHSVIDDYVTFGGNARVHQHAHIGKHAMIAAGSIVLEDVLPFTMVVGSSANGRHGAVHRTINKIGLERAINPENGERVFSDDDIRDIHKAFKTIFRNGNSLEQSAALLRAQTDEGSPAREMADFIEQSLHSKRGIAPASDKRQTSMER